MRPSKKFILIAVLATLALVGGIAGVVLAENEDNARPETPFQTLLERACQIYEQNTGVAVDPQELEKAFAQAAKGMQIEALKDRLQSLVEEGKITQEQADEYLEWWQSRPDIRVRPGFAGPGFPGMGRMHGWGKWCPRPGS